MIRKLSISAALVGMLGVAVLLAPASETGALRAAAPDAAEIAAPVFSNVVVNHNNG